MTTTAAQTVEGYLGDMIAVLKHVGGAVSRHAKDERLLRVAGCRAVIEHADGALRTQLEELERYAQAHGGTGLSLTLKESLTAVSGFFTGLYAVMRHEAASRMLRDDYTGISFALGCAQMLHTTAHATGETDLAQVLHRHIRKLAQLVVEINDVLPHAVLADLGADHVPIAEAHAADLAVGEHADAWAAAAQNARTRAQFDPPR